MFSVGAQRLGRLLLLLLSRSVRGGEEGVSGVRRLVRAVGAAVDVSVRLQAVLGRPHHVGGLHRRLHEDHDVVDLDGGHGAEGIDVGGAGADLHAHGVVDLALAKRQDAGGVVQLTRADHRLQVEDLAGHALHHHREEVGVGEIEHARHVHLDPHVGVVEAHRHGADPVVHHHHSSREEEEGHEGGGQQTEHHRQDHVQFRSLRLQPLVTVWDQSHQLIHLTRRDPSRALTRRTRDAVPAGELHVGELGYVLPADQPVQGLVVGVSVLRPPLRAAPVRQQRHAAVAAGPPRPHGG